MIKQEFLKKMQEKKYFQGHRKVLVAVSGGLDSMTLLQLLIDSQKELAIELAIAHVNHKQQPEMCIKKMIQSIFQLKIME